MTIADSALAALEPILGISIAINLAYLNLPKFQYISQVQVRLRKRLEALDPNVKASVQHTAWYCQLVDLASVETLELGWPQLKKKPWIDAPGIWGFVYNFFFYWRSGRGVSLLATAYSIFLLLLGSGHTSGSVSIGLDYFNRTILYHFILSSISAIWPILTVVAGEYVCIRAARFVQYQTKSLKEAALSDAEQTVAALTQVLSDATAGPDKPIQSSTLVP